MKDEYGFTGAECGRFFRKDAELRSPVHLDANILTCLTDRARGGSLSELVNQLLRKDIERIEVAG